MRVTQSSEQTQFLTQLDTLESNIATTQNQISSGDTYTLPSQDPAAAGAVDNFQQVLAQSQQYSSNANTAQSSLNTEDTALTQVQTQLQSLRDLALQANSGTASSQNLAAIATQAQQIQASLLSLANTQDGSGNYIFSGYASQTQPFSLTATGANYAGDQGQPHVQIAAGQTLATGDNGDTVFNQIPSGNGTFAVAAAPGNTGTGLIGATTVANPGAATGGPFAIDFTSPNAYKVLDASNNVVDSGAYTAGQTIAFSGLNVKLGGQPATGDSFAVAPGANGVVTLTPNAANTGSGVAQSSGYTQGAYRIDFTSNTPSTYQVLNAGNTVVASGTYSAGQSIAFGGLKVAVSGAPVAGDTFNVSPGLDATYTVAAAGANTGSGYAGPVQYPADNYSIDFLTPTSYQVLDANHNAVTAGTYTSGQAIVFANANVTLTGQPAAGDSFTVTPSTKQSVFTTVQNLVTALQSGSSSPASQTQLSNSIAGIIHNIDQALTNASTVQASVGGRLNSITTQLSVGTSQQAQLTQSISSLQGLNYATAYTTLESQNTTLSAAMQAFTLTQGLTLFKYIQ
jgi:flagellar hook-associated protein 3 FlgL